MEPDQIPAASMDELRRIMDNRRWRIEGAKEILVFSALYSSCLFGFQWFGYKLYEKFMIAGLCTGFVVCVATCYCKNKILNWYERRQNANTEGSQQADGQQDSRRDSEHSTSQEDATASTMNITQNKEHESRDINIKTRQTSDSLSESSTVPAPTSKKVQNTYSNIQIHSTSSLPEASNEAGTSGTNRDTVESQQSQRDLEDSQEMDLVSPNQKYVMDILQLIKEINYLAKELKLINSSFKETASEIVDLKEKAKSVAENIAKIKDAVDKLKVFQLTEVKSVQQTV